MIYRYLFGVLFIVISCFCSAQGSEKNWLFGNQCAIEFLTGGPIPSIYAGVGSQMNMREGGTSISDSSGNLLFYFSGNSIYNSAHTTMTNGVLAVSTSYYAAQGTAIVKAPDSDSLYYVFYTDDWGSSNGLNYAVVDMSLYGGNGAVVLKDQVLNVNVKERIVAVNRPCHSEIWIVGHEKGNNNYVSYILTGDGIDTIPFVSSTGAVHSSYSGVNNYGFLRLSKDATKLALASGGESGATLELSDFDLNTGIVSNTITLANNTDLPNAYGVEFSPNGELLYATEFDQNTVYQFNLSAGDSNQIRASKIAIDNGSSINKGALICGPDGKIYVALRNSSFLSVIDNPNFIGTPCNYFHSVISTNGTVSFGLPNFAIALLNGCSSDTCDDCIFNVCTDCIPSYSPFNNKTYVLSAWVKEEDPLLDKTTYDEAQIALYFTGAGTTAGPFKAKGNIIDGWQRIEETFTIPSNATDIEIKLSSPGVDGYFDDIRVFPTDGSMKSYVYDPITLRLVAELDENNYATYYEYDEEGMLVRVKKETARGIMTIQENRNSTPKQ